MVHFLVFRPLRNAAPLGKVIGSVGVLTYLTGVMQLNFSSLNNPNPRTIVPEEPLDNFLWLGRSFARSSLYLAAIALARRLRPLGALPLHPLRHRHPCRSRQREGRRAARLLAGVPGRCQLGDRLASSPASPPSSSGRSAARCPRCSSPRSSASSSPPC